MNICKAKGMRLRLIAILLCLVLMVGIIPVQVFADDGDGGEEIDDILRVSASLCFTPTASYYKDVPIVKDRGCALLVKVLSENVYAGGSVSVELYEETDGEKVSLGTVYNQQIAATGDTRKPASIYAPFDWTPTRSGDVTFSYCVKNEETAEELYTGETTVSVLEQDPENLIPLHHRYENGGICGYLTGLKLDGAYVESSTIQSDSDAACEIAVVLEKTTQQNASFTLHTIVNRAKNCPGIGDTAGGSKTDARFFKSGFPVTLEQGATTFTFWAGPSAGKMTRKYILTFSIAQESTSGDPEPVSVKALNVTTPPSAPYQVAGQKFDRAGMVVTATLTDDTTVPVVGYTVEPDGPLTLSNTKVTLRYGTVSVEFPITVRPSTQISDVQILNGGQILPDLKFLGAAGVGHTKNAYYAFVKYGETAGRFSFRVPEGTEVYISDKQQPVDTDGVCTISIHNGQASSDENGKSLSWTADDEKVRVQSADDPTIYTEYSFACHIQKLPGMPDQVTDYLCIGSQYTNGSGLGPYGLNAVGTLSGYATSANQDIAAPPTSLGNFGGYIVYYYKDAITDDPNHPYGVDMVISGNSYNSTNKFAEPGQVWVSEDGNTWYALAGSEHYNDTCDWDYAVTYHADKTYTDNHGNSGGGDIYKFPVKEYYPLHTWPEEEVTELTMHGIWLKESDGENEYGNTTAASTSFGYVDCGEMGYGTHVDNPYSQTPRRVDGFDLQWAVDENGFPVDVSQMAFHYVKIQTASHIVNGAIGEKSTEVSYMFVPQPEEKAVGKTEMPASITVDGKKLELKEGQTIYEAEVSGGFNVEVEAPLNANVYINSNYARLVPFVKIPEHKLVRVIVQEGRKEPCVLLIKLSEGGEAQKASTITFDAKGGWFNTWRQGGYYRGGVSEVTYTYDAGMQNAPLPIPIYRDNQTFTLDKSMIFKGWSYEGKTYTVYSSELPEELKMTAVWEQKLPEPYDGDPEAQHTVTVYFSLTQDGEYVVSEATGRTMAQIPVTVDYFDLANYGLAELSRRYCDQSTQPFEQPTGLHLFITALEQYYLGLPEDECGEGMLKKYPKLLTVTGSSGHMYMQRFWDHDENLTYFVNHEYPLMSEKIGATADWIILKDGDVIEVAMYKDWNFWKKDESGFMGFRDSSDHTVDRLEAASSQPVTLHTIRTYADMNTAVTYCAVAKNTQVYYTTDTYFAKDVSKWNKLAVSDENGEFSYTFQNPGTYYIGIPGSDVCAPGVCVVTVTDSTVHVTGVELSKDSLELNVGESETLKAVVKPENATIQSVTWKSTDETVATVDADGKVKAVAPGTAEIIATTTDGSYEAVCKVTVTDSTVHVTGIELNKDSLKLYVGESETLKAVVKPENATIQSVTWKSTDETVATVDADGRVKAVASGTAEIIATTTDGGYEAVCKVTVQKKDTPITPPTPSKPTKPSTPTKPDTSKDNLPFTDVVSGSWYYDGVKYAYDNGLMNGTGANAFNPNADTTRGMIVTILARMEGVNTSGGATWYAAGREWAMGAGISDGTNMTGKITREQLAAMLYRYAKMKGYDVSASADISGYTDASGVSGWAKEAMQWAVGSGLIQGSGNALTPQANASRAQIATILMRFAQSIAK